MPAFTWLDGFPERVLLAWRILTRMDFSHPVI
jgi:hypothetical protein